MLQWLRRLSDTSRKAEELYGSVVAAARQPFFYKAMGVPDTPEGRFELVALHLYLALEGVQGKQGGDGALVQRTIEVFVTDMDDCMREMGVGDLSVPKKVKRAAAGFYERAGAYRAALASPAPGSLESALANYVFAGCGAGEARVAAAARYVREVAAATASRSFDELLSSGALLKLLDGRDEVGAS